MNGFRALLPLALLCLAACQKNDTAHSIYALTSTGSIISFTTDKPGSITESHAVSGLASGESLVQIAYRPKDSVLYGITSNNLLVTVAPDTGVVSAVSGTAFTGDTLSGAAISFDPVQDELRIVATQYNLRVATDGTLLDSGTKLQFDSGDANSGVTPQIAAIAYDNPAADASSTTLYALDVTSQSLVRVGSASVGATSTVDAGLLHTIGTTGVSFTANAGLSVLSGDSTAYAALQQSGKGAALYAISLGTGAASSLGTIGGGGQTLISIALVPGD